MWSFETYWERKAGICMYFVSAWEKIKEGVVISNKLQEMSRYSLLFVIDWESMGR